MSKGSYWLYGAMILAGLVIGTIVTYLMSS